ncbi:MAG: hypothetical protein EPO68_17955 [Planctomycetota bacterium]|nr:MAG: hypothetical protein EPO68_17955 [Planctomycetota bacterium]
MPRPSSVPAAGFRDPCYRRPAVRSRARSQPARFPLPECLSMFRRFFTSFAFVVSLALGAPLGAQTLPLGATLLKDVRPGSDAQPMGTFVHHSAATPTYTVFRGFNLPTGAEPWVSDGTTAGTHMLADVFPGDSSGLPLQSYGPQGAALGGFTFFAAYTPASGTELWRTDGTAAGTSLVLEIGNGATGSQPTSLVTHGGYVYFLAENASGMNVWRTDGTSAGTTIALDMAGAFGTHLGSLDMLISAAGRLWLWELTGPTTRRLFCSDGTLAGTQIVRSFTAVLPLNSSAIGIGFGGKLYFALRTSPVQLLPDRGVWVSDGTAAGTHKVHTEQGTAWIAPTASKVVFASTSPQGDWLLHATDGTAAGTTSLGQYKLWVSVNPNESLEPAPIGNGVCFSALRVGGSGGYELEFTDGTAAGTYPMVDINPGPAHAQCERLTAWNGRVYFTAFEPQRGRELWRSDGTPAGTRLVADLTPGSESTVFDYHPSFQSMPGGLSFGAAVGATGQEPWITDGTSAGTKLLANIAPDAAASSNIALVERLGTRAVFTAHDGVHGRELWTSDGTGAGTQLLLDAAPGAASGGPTAAAVLDGRLLFDGGPVGDRELWISDGTSPGTHELVDIDAQAQSLPEQFLAAEGRVYFVAFSFANGYEVWSSDGTAAGTALTSDLVVAPVLSPPSPSTARPKLLATVGARVYFTWQRFQVPGLPDTGVELFVSDGTSAGTQLVADLTPGLGSSQFYEAARVGDRLAFAFNTPTLGFELWTTDGTPSGTQPLLDLFPGPEGSFAQNLATYGDRLLFGASDGTTSYLDLWISDGTGAGTQKLLPQSAVGPLLATNWHAPDGEIPGPLAWFQLGGPLSPNELWRTDGTAAGTFRAHAYDVSFQTFEKFPTQYVLGDVGAGGAHAFIKSTTGSGVEMWIADGSLDGVTHAADTHVGPLGANPRDVVRIGNQLLFVADDGITGEELHALPFGLLPAFDASSYGHGCSSQPLAPRIGSSGALVLGANASIDLADALQATSAILFWSGAAAQLELGNGCAALLAQPVLLATASTGAFGAASKSFTIPVDPALLGAPFHFQWAVLEPAGPLFGALGLSDGLEVLVGP